MHNVVFQKVVDKILDWEAVATLAEQWRAKEEVIVFTNGCFDILHYGHLHYLAEARSLGQRLIIGINAEASVKRLKGEHRPINDELTRMHSLASLGFVDAVVSFDEDTPLDLIKKTMPDILVKGGDWAPEQIVGSDFVIKNGGLVRSLPFVEGYSTTNIEQKIIDAQLKK